MNNKATITIRTLIIWASVGLILTSCSQNWPQFRGGDDNMVVNNRNLPTEWGVDTNMAWAYDMEGSSWSSPIIWGDKVFITASLLEKKAQRPDPPEDETEEERREREDKDTSYLNDMYRWELICLDLNNGEEIWKKTAHRGSPEIKTHAGNTYASETPVTDGERIYVYYGMIGLFCFDMDGNPLWNKDLGAYKTLYDWGTGTSPVVYDGILYIQVDNEEEAFVVALDAASGEEIWKANRDEKTNYSTPVIWKNRERTELVVSGMTARSYNLKTGDIYWKLNLKGRRNIASAIPDKDVLYIGNTGGRGDNGTLFAVKPGSKGDITPEEGDSISDGLLWSNMDAGTGNPSPLLYEGLIYNVSGRGGQVQCIDASNGKTVYKEKVNKAASCWATPWANKDVIYFMDERGTTHEIKAGREFDIMDKNKLDDRFWASPAITKSSYILKGAEKVYCIR